MATTLRPLIFLLLSCLFAGLLTATPARAEDDRAALALFADASGLHNGGEYALAADKWRQFIEKYPKHDRIYEAYFFLGFDLLSLRKYEPAIDAYKKAVAGGKKLKFLEQGYLNLGAAQYGLANIYRGKQMTEQANKMYAAAADSYQELVTTFPEGQFVHAALWYRGEALYSLGKLEEAATAYKKVVTDHPKSKWRADALYALGATREEQRQWETAIRVYDIFLEEFPQHDLVSEVRMRRADALLELGLQQQKKGQGDPQPKFAEAAKVLGEVAAVEGFHSPAYARFRQARATAAQDKHAAAGKLYAQVAEKYPSFGDRDKAMILGAHAFYRAEDYDNAAKWFGKVVDAGGADLPEAAHFLCRIHLRRGEAKPAADLAARALTAAREKTPMFVPWLLMDQADALYGLPDKKADALSIYIQVAEKHAEHDQAPSALYYAAFTAQELKNYEQAVSLAQQFVEKYPDHKLLPDVKYVAAECHLLLSQYAKAEEAYRDLVASHQGHADHERWQVRLGQTLYVQEKYADALEVLEPVSGELKAAESQAKAQTLIGLSRYFLKRYADAEKALKASLAAEPKSKDADEVTYYLALAQKEQDKYQPAAATLRTLIADFPETPFLDSAHYHLGQALFNQDKLADAAKEFRTVTEKWPESKSAPFAYYYLGWSQFKQQDFKAAESAFTSLIDGHPQHELTSESFSARAEARRRLGNYAGAATDVDAFLKSDASGQQKSNALLIKGLSLYELKNYGEAATAYEKILSSDPKYRNTDRVLYELGWAYQKGGQTDKSVDAFKKLVENHAQSRYAPESHYNIGNGLYFRENEKDRDYPQALKHFERAVATADGKELKEKAFYMVGWCHFKLDRFDKAAEAFDKQIALSGPDSSRWSVGVYMRAECLFKTEKYAEALPVYKDLLAKATKLSGSQRETALLHAGQAASYAKAWQESIDLLAQYVEKYPESDLLPAALYEQGWAYQNLDRLDEAEKKYRAAYQHPQARNATGARAGYMLGELLLGQRKFDEAGKQFKLVVFSYGGAAAPEDVKLWQVRSAYQVARIAEGNIQAAQGEQRDALMQTAKKYYGIVTERLPDSQWATRAQARLKALAELE